MSETTTEAQPDQDKPPVENSDPKPENEAQPEQPGSSTEGQPDTPDTNVEPESKGTAVEAQPGDSGDSAEQEPSSADAIEPEGSAVEAQPTDQPDSPAEQQQNSPDREPESTATAVDPQQDQPNDSAENNGQQNESEKEPDTTPTDDATGEENEDTEGTAESAPAHDDSSRDSKPSEIEAADTANDDAPSDTAPTEAKPEERAEVSKETQQASAALLIQAWLRLRCHSKAAQGDRLRQRKHACATLIQSRWRGITVRSRKLHLQWRQKSLAAGIDAFALALIQRVGRGAISRVSHRVPPPAMKRTSFGDDSEDHPFSSMVKRRQSYVPVGYRRATNNAEFERRKSVLQAQVEDRLAARIQQWWRRLRSRQLSIRHRVRLDRLVLLNANAILIQRWWKYHIFDGCWRRDPHPVEMKLPPPAASAKAIIELEEHRATRALQHRDLRSVWADAVPIHTKAVTPSQLPPLRHKAVPSRAVPYSIREKPEGNAPGRYSSHAAAGRTHRFGWNDSTMVVPPSWYTLPRGITPDVSKRKPKATPLLKSI